MAVKAKKSPASKAGDMPVTPKPKVLTKEQELAAYREMLLIRRFEEKAGQLYGMDSLAASAISISVRKQLLSVCRWRQ